MLRRSHSLSTLTVLGLLTALALSACTGDDAETDSGVDASTVDAGVDGGAPDSGPADAGPRDSGPFHIDDAGPLSERLGPDVGFFASVVFHPTLEDQVWASGDDGSGLYYSTDGGEGWRFAYMPYHREWSTYALRFDPLDPSRVIAASHFGRGVLRSLDGGTTWARTAATGLPLGPGEAAYIHDLVFGPEGAFVVATGSGLFRSADGGETFTRGAGAPEMVFRAVARGAEEYLAGADDGRLYRSADGSSWTALGDGGTPISSIVRGAEGYYVATTRGLVLYTDLAGTLEVIVDPSTDPSRGSLLWTKLAVSGETRARERVIVGTTVQLDGASHPHLHLSDDGGASWRLANGGIDDASVFDVAISPHDPDHLVLGTVGSGLFVSRDAGESWTRGQGELQAAAVLGLAVDPTDPTHLLISSTEGLEGTPGVYESEDDGTSWTLVPDTPRDALALAFAPDDPSVVLLGAFSAPGIFRSADGVGGPYVAAALDEGVSRFRLFADGPWFALGTGGGLHRSADDGLTWSPVSGVGPLTTDVARLGDGALVACGATFHRSDDGFESSEAIDGPALAATEASTTCAALGEGLLVGTTAGRVFSTESLDPPSWTETSPPLVDADVRQVADFDGRWVVCGMRADDDAAPTTRSGLFVSYDRGATWEAIPGLCWSFVPTGGSRLTVGFWGGGAWHISLP